MIDRHIKYQTLEIRQ